MKFRKSSSFSFLYITLWAKGVRTIYVQFIVQQIASCAILVILEFRQSILLFYRREIFVSLLYCQNKNFTMLFNGDYVVRHVLDVVALLA